MKLLTFHNGGTLIGLEERERESERVLWVRWVVLRRGVEGEEE